MLDPEAYELSSQLFALRAIGSAFRGAHGRPVLELLRDALADR